MPPTLGASAAPSALTLRLDQLIGADQNPQRVTNSGRPGIRCSAPRRTQGPGMKRDGREVHGELLDHM